MKLDITREDLDAALGAAYLPIRPLPFVRMGTPINYSAAAVFWSGVLSAERPLLAALLVAVGILVSVAGSIGVAREIWS